MPPKRVRQHITDTLAQKIFEAHVAGWTAATPHVQDYGIDYTLEVFVPDVTTEMQAAGLDFQVQLKGTRRPRSNAQEIKIDFSRDRILHFLRNKRIPVFLVIVDVNAKHGYFLFLQGYASQNGAADWSSGSGNIRLRIPRENKTEDQPRFEAAVRSAHDDIKRLHPTAIQDVIHIEQRKLLAQDSRLSKVEIIATEKGQSLRLTPKDNITLNLSLSGQSDSLEHFIRDFIEYGREVCPAEHGVEATITGLPLAANESQPISKIQFARSLPGSVRLIRREHNIDVASFELDGSWLVGSGGGSFAAAFPNNLLSFAADLKRKDAKGIPISARVTFNMDDWIGKNVANGLRYYDRLESVFRWSEEAPSIVAELYMDGQRIGSHLFGSNESSWFLKTASTIECFRMARYISKRTNTSLTCQHSLSEQDYNDLSFAYNFLQGLPVSFRGSSGSFRTYRTSHSVEMNVSQTGQLLLKHDSFPCTVFTTTVNCGPAEIVCDTAIIRATSMDSDTIGWEFEPASGSSFTARTARSAGGINTGS